MSKKKPLEPVKPPLNHILSINPVDGRVRVILSEVYLFTLAYMNAQFAENFVKDIAQKQPEWMKLTQKDSHVAVWATVDVTEHVIPKDIMEKYSLDRLQHPFVAQKAITAHVNYVIRTKDYQDQLDKQLSILRTAWSDKLKTIMPDIDKDENKIQ